MKLYIISPQSKEEFDIVWLEVETPVGNFVIQTGHEPTVLVLSPEKDITFRLKIGKHKSVTVKQGIVEITRSTATVLLSQ